MLQFKRLKELSLSLNINVAVTNVVVLLLQLFIVLHLVACFWYFLTTSYSTGITQNDTPPTDGQDWNVHTWSTQFNYEFASTFTKYIVSMYWSFFTIFGVGFGDIHAVTTGERFFSVCVMMIGTVFQGAVISKVSRVIKSSNLLTRAIDEKMVELKLFLDDKRIPMQVKHDAGEVYGYYLQRRPGLLESDTFHTLPKAMLYKLIHQAFDKEMQQIRFFRQQDIHFVSHLITHTIPYHCKPGDVLYDRGDVAEELAFVSKGTVSG